jgi:hypothetical protein
MPNFEEGSVTDWLEEIRPVQVAQDWPPAVRPIETVGDAPQLLTHLGELLDEICAADPSALSEALRSDPLRPCLQTVLAQLGTARALRLVHWLSEQEIPELHLIVAGLTAGDRAEAQALRHAITRVLRRGTLRRTFAPDRVIALQQAATAALKPEEVT